MTRESSLQWGEKNPKYRNILAAFCLVKVFCGGNGLDLYGFIISNIVVHTVSLLQKLMVYGLPCNVGRSLLTVQLSLLLSLKCDFLALKPLMSGRLDNFFAFCPWCGPWALLALESVSDEFLKPSVSSTCFILLFTGPHNVVQCFLSFKFHTCFFVEKKSLLEYIGTIEFSFISFSSVLRTFWYFSCRTLFPNKSHVTSAVRCNKSSLRIT